MKKNLLKTLALSMLLASLVGCTNTDKENEATNQKNYEIGILQLAEHGSLDNCTEGFIAGLASEGIVEGENLTIEFKNAFGDVGITGQIANYFGSEFKDLVCAIATPAAQIAYNAVMDRNIPVVYTAVTDPVMAELATEDGMPVGYVTGTSNQLPVEEQLQMIRAIMPEATTIGIMYTISEVNSVSNVAVYESLAGKYGFDLQVMSIASAADIPLVMDLLLGEVDCITNLTDNTVVNSLATVIGLANEAGIPVFGSEIEQVKMGCVAAQGLDYVALGHQTGVMAAKILRGEERANSLPFELITESELTINTAVAEMLELEIPEVLINEAVTIFNEVIL